ncbi:MAG: thymidylate synthase [Candidatus Freyarchaeota archaeon]|nr:thymidylate synthase [Candidatus Jordarchaeia archaeon]
MKIYVLYADEFGEKVAGNLVNFSTFCTSCGDACEHCRRDYGSFAGYIYGLHRVPQDLPPFLENPEDYFPRDPPRCDLLIVVGVHQDILASVDALAERMGVKGVIVPIEDGGWCPVGLQKQVEKSLEEIGVASAFPRPFCTLEERGTGDVVDQFVRECRVGRPVVEVEVQGDMITKGRVLRTAPCGSTFYVMQQIKLTRIYRLNERIAEAHHAYPCTASMQYDKTIGDTYLHIGGYAIRNAVVSSLQVETLNSCKYR